MQFIVDLHLIWGEALILSELYNKSYYENYGTLGTEWDYGDGIVKEYFRVLAKEIVDDLAPKTVLDVGCAWGFLVEAFRDLGVEAYGVDISPYAISRVRDDIKPYCVAGSIMDDLPKSFPKRFDLVITVEMIEHLHEEECLPAIEKLCSYSDRVIVSSTSDDITDPTHYNVQQPEYWVKKFAQFGYFNRPDYKLKNRPVDTLLYEKSDDIPSVAYRYEHALRMNTARLVSEQNARNGYIATVYPDTDGSITTDLMQEIPNIGPEFRFRMNDLSGVQGVRFDPLEGLLCIVKNARVLSDKGHLPIECRNGRVIGNYSVFFTKDPQFYIEIPQDVSWIEIEASIYPMHEDIMPDFLVSLKDLINEVEETKRAHFLLEQKSRTLQYNLDVANIHYQTLKGSIWWRVTGPGRFFTRALRWAVRKTLRRGGAAQNLPQFAPVENGQEESSVISVSRVVEHPAIQYEYDLLKLQYQALENSFWWKITKPARMTVGGVKWLVRNFPLTRPAYRWLFKKRYGASYGVSLICAPFYLSAHEYAAQERYEFPRNVKISIITPLYNTPEKFLAEMIESVINQTYPNWELCLADGSDDAHEQVRKICQKYAKKDARIKYRKLENNLGISGNSNKSIEMATGEYLGLLDHDDVLHPSALFEVMKVICERDSDFIYTDEAIFGEDISRPNPKHHKPEFAPDYLRSVNYIGHFSCFKKSILDKAGWFKSEYDGSQDHDLILRLTEISEGIVRIPQVLYFWRSHSGSVAGSGATQKPYALEAAKRAIADHIARVGLSGVVEYAVAPNLSIYKINYEINGTPLVSIIIPNKDNIDCLRKCIDSIEHKSTYSNYEVLIIENNSTEPATFEYYESIKSDKIKIVKYEGNFNYSKINNFGETYAKGEYLLCLNNDIEVITPSWIEEMLMFAQRADVGAVGAKLCYADNTIQHAGVILGLGGVAAHSHKHYRRNNLGYMYRTGVAQNLSAVTAACLLLRRDVFESVGGFDESIAVDFNDVDLCMRIRRKELLVVYTPYAELYHHESKTRGTKDTEKEQNQFLRESALVSRRWKHELEKGDPYYNPNLTLDREDFTYADVKNVKPVSEPKLEIIPNCDIIFINGCDYSVPHPIRYRVDHQLEQLQANNISCHSVFYQNLTMDYLRYARGFIIFRCPHSEEIEKFIKKAKELNKHVFFDIDDLVIDTKFTDTLAYVKQISPEEKAAYDGGVLSMQKTMMLCDSIITTTTDLANELKNYLPEVFINRNVASEEMLSLSQQALAEKEFNRRSKKRQDKIILGYFSGSISHNENYEMILPALLRVLKENENVHLMITGILDVPPELEAFKKRIIVHPFVEWKELPNLIASIDINLAPLVDTMFNACKSENKWVEAALVKVPTVASNVGAFAQMIESGKTGMLCTDESEWYEALSSLVSDSQLRGEIAEEAYNYCMKHCLTMYTGMPLANYIFEKIRPNVFMVLPGFKISGGVYVALKHSSMLKEKGYDVTLVDMQNENDWYEFEGHTFPVLDSTYSSSRKIDCAVATLWATVKYLETNAHIKQKYYLVQGFETDFYPPPSKDRRRSNRTYNLFTPIDIITISKWCQSWLKDDFDKESEYAPNGIDIKQFSPVKRTFDKKVRILIEGDCYYDRKNIDESFEITNKLDPSRFEIWYMSYNATPKGNYRIDKFLHNVPFDSVGEVYRSCDILVKSSILESFSYPPLEMMATGGFAIVAPNGGNAEYLKDGENCLLYELGNVEDALKKIDLICKDEALRERLYDGGQKTAQSRSWDNIKDDILALYEKEDTKR